MTMQELATAVAGELHGSSVKFTGVSTDTRTLAADDLFVALRGPHFDGHAFAVKGQVNGAAGILAHQRLGITLPQVTVADTGPALGRLGEYWRGRFEIPLIAVTGSNGKTTVKEMIGAILGCRQRGLVSQGNLNNDIGVPLVLCRLRDDHEFAVIEMGMNHRGEIDYLSRMAMPTVAVITNAAAAHLAGLNSVDAVAKAKAEIFNGLQPGGTAIINADDEFSSLWQRRLGGHRCITFGLNDGAEVSAFDIEVEDRGCRFTLCYRKERYQVEIKFAGRHNVLNALAAAAAAMAVGANGEQIRAGLASLLPVPGRLVRRKAKNGTVVIDDTYNANPASVTAAIEVLAASAGKTVLVLGDMGELGAAGDRFHAEAGICAKRAGIQQLLGVGALSRHATDSFGDGARVFTSKDTVIEYLQPMLGPGLTVLVKGSRFMQMEDVVAALVGGTEGES